MLTPRDFNCKNDVTEVVALSGLRQRSINVQCSLRKNIHIGKIFTKLVNRHYL